MKENFAVAPRKLCAQSTLYSWADDALCFVLSIGPRPTASHTALTCSKSESLIRCRALICGWSCFSHRATATFDTPTSFATRAIRISRAIMASCKRSLNVLMWRFKQYVAAHVTAIVPGCSNAQRACLNFSYTVFRLGCT